MKLNYVLRLALIACTLSLALGAQGAKLKISTLYPDRTFAVDELRKAAKSIEEKTDKRVQIKIYPGGVMGSDQAVERKIRIGQLHGFLATGGALAGAYPDSQVYNAPLAFNNFDEVDFVRSQMDAKIVEGFKQNGWQVFGLIESGFAYPMAQKDILSVDDLKSSKLWLPANDPISEKIAKAFDVSAIYMGIGDVLGALQTGAVDSIIAPPVAALTLQWYSKVKTLSDLPFMYTYSVVALSNKAFNKIDEKDREVVQQAFKTASRNIDAQSRKDNIAAFDALKAQGIKVNTLSEKESASIQSKTVDATKILVKQGEFSQAMYDSLLTLLTKYRSKK